MRKLCLLGAFCAVLQAQPGEGDKLAPYYPTPNTIVEKMLQMGGLKAGEKMFDLGSGDGRIVLMAATTAAQVEHFLAGFQAAHLQHLLDLGSGDGRIVLMAAQKFHAQAVGVELDKDLCKQSI